MLFRLKLSLKYLVLRFAQERNHMGVIWALTWANTILTFFIVVHLGFFNLSTYDPHTYFFFHFVSLGSFCSAMIFTKQQSKYATYIHRHIASCFTVCINLTSNKKWIAWRHVWLRSWFSCWSTYTSEKDLHPTGWGDCYNCALYLDQYHNMSAKFKRKSVYVFSGHGWCITEKSIKNVQPHILISTM